MEASNPQTFFEPFSSIPTLKYLWYFVADTSGGVKETWYRECRGCWNFKWRNGTTSSICFRSHLHFQGCRDAIAARTVPSAWTLNTEHAAAVTRTLFLSNRECCWSIIFVKGKLEKASKLILKENNLILQEFNSTLTFAVILICTVGKSLDKHKNLLSAVIIGK